MFGLLDNLDDPRKQALLMMGLGLLSGAPKSHKNFGADFGHAGLLGLQGYMGAKESQSRQQNDKTANEYQGLQLQQLRQSLADDDLYRGALANAPDPSAPRAPNMAPTPENAANLKKPSPYEQASMMVEYLRSKKVPEKHVKPYLEQMEKFRPKFKADQQLVKLPDGSLGMLNLAEDGTPQVIPYTPAEKMKDVNLGGSVSMVGEYSGRPGQSFARSMTPEGKDASARGWAGINQTEQHFQQNLRRPQYDSERGAFVVPPVGGDGPAQIPVPGLQSGKTLPAGELDKLGGVKSLRRLAEEASKDVTAVVGKGGQVSGAVLGRLPDFVRDWVSAEGIPARQKLANLTSREFLERSGAAVTESEAERLKPYTPQPTDSEATILKKLSGLQTEYDAILRERMQNFEQGGYRVPSSGWSIRPLGK